MFVCRNTISVFTCGHIKYTQIQAQITSFEQNFLNFKACIIQMDDEKQDGATVIKLVFQE